MTTTNQLEWVMATIDHLITRTPASEALLDLLRAHRMLLAIAPCPTVPAPVVAAIASSIVLVESPDIFYGSARIDARFDDLVARNITKPPAPPRKPAFKPVVTRAPEAPVTYRPTPVRREMPMSGSPEPRCKSCWYGKFNPGAESRYECTIEKARDCVPQALGRWYQRRS